MSSMTVGAVGPGDTAVASRVTGGCLPGQAYAHSVWSSPEQPRQAAQGPVPCRPTQNQSWGRRTCVGRKAVTAGARGPRPRPHQSLLHQWRNGAQCGGLQRGCQKHTSDPAVSGEEHLLGLRLPAHVPAWGAGPQPCVPAAEREKRWGGASRAAMCRDSSGAGGWHQRPRRVQQAPAKLSCPFVP